MKKITALERMNEMEQVFSAWNPVTAEQGEGSFSLSVWGRTYRFDHSLFPTEITTAGQSILASPIQLQASFDQKTGEWKDFWYLVTAQTEEQVVILTSAKCENLIANATVTVEFDGFVKIELRLLPFWSFAPNGQGTARLDGLSLKTEVKEEFSSLFHYWPNDKTSIIPAADVINAGATQSQAFPFKPYVWTGWEWGGLGMFYGESEQGFTLKDPDQCLVIERQPGKTSFTLHILDQMPTDWQRKKKDLWVKTLKPLQYTFGFQATPVKPMPEQREEYYKRMHGIWEVQNNAMAHCSQSFIYQEDYLQQCAKNGVKWIIFHEEWSAIQNYGRPADEEKFCKLVEQCHALGMKTMVYFGYEYSSLVPEFNRNADSFLIKTPEGDYTGGWQREPAQRDFMVCYQGGYAEEMLRRVAHVMDDYGVDGIYTDGTFVPWECANEAHGCGWRDETGELHPSFPVLAVREHVKKLYRLVHERGGILDTHQSSCCIMPTLAFCDSYYDGENIQSLLRKHPESMTPDSFQAEFFGYNLGIPCNFIAYTRGEDYPFSYPAGFSLVHNVFPRPSQRWDLDFMGKIWEIFDRYDLNNAPWQPYFEQSEVTASGALVSYYRLEQKAVAVIYDPQRGRKKLPISAPGFCKVTDLLNDISYALDGGCGALPAKACEVQMYLLEK